MGRIKKSLTMGAIAMASATTIVAAGPQNIAAFIDKTKEIGGISVDGVSSVLPTVPPEDARRLPANVCCSFGRHDSRSPRLIYEGDGGYLRECERKTESPEGILPLCVLL